MTFQPSAEAARDKAEFEVAPAASYSHQPSLLEVAPCIEQNLTKLSVRKQHSQINTSDITPDVLSDETTSGSVEIHVPKTSVTPTLVDELYRAASKKGCAHASNVAHCENFQYRKTAKVGKSHSFSCYT